MKQSKIAINGFGRIGRAFFKLALTQKELEIVAINDLGNLKNLAYLLKYDSVYGRFSGEIEVQSNELVINSKRFKFLSEKDPLKLPWNNLGIDVVVESTGVFETYEKAAVHIKAGAKRVVLTAPAKDEDTDDAKTVLMGVNPEALKTCIISSNGSCTTNSASPIIQILSEKLGIKKAFLNTVHGYTATQALIDGPTRGSDPRKGRAAGINIVPTTTGAAIAVGRAVESVRKKFDGVAMRVPVATGSLSAIILLSEKTTTAEEINSILKEAEKEERWEGIFKTTEDPIVSTDIVGEAHAAVADLTLTKVVGGDLCAVYSWYDNEFGYTNTLVRHVAKVGEVL